MMGEPGPPQKMTIEDVSFTLWDRWEIRGDTSITLAAILSGISKFHNGKLVYRDIFYGSQPIMIKSLVLAKNPGLANISEWEGLKKPLLSYVQPAEILELTVTFEKGDDIHKDVPKIRVIISQDTKNVEENFQKEFSYGSDEIIF
jgi:hypothetical protein